MNKVLLRLKQPSSWLGIATFAIIVANGGPAAITTALPELMVALGLIAVDA